MQKRFAVLITLLAMIVLSGCPGGDYNGVQLGGGTAVTPPVDTTPPTVLSTSPTNSATNVGTTATISASFSEPILIAGATFTVTAGGVPVTGTISVFGTATVIFNYTGSLAAGTTYTATVAGVTDLSGNPLAAPRTWSFTTAAATDTTPPTVVSVAPTNLATNVSIKTNIAAVFSESLAAGTVTSATFLVSTGGTPVTGTVTPSGANATFTPGSLLSSNTTYSASLTTGITDLAGNPLAAAYNWSFTTAPAPSITTTSPLPNATETGPYSQTLAAAGGFGAKTWSATGLPAWLSMASSTGILSGTPPVGAAAGSPYTINVTVTDADGLTATQTFSLTVITGPVISTTTLPAGTETQTLYSQTLVATGGTGPYTWTTGSTLPANLTLSSGGVLSGTLASGAAAGSPYTINVTATDSASAVATQALTLTVNAVPAVTTASLATAQVGIAYGPVALTATGGTTPYASWNASGLPSGLSFNTSTGTISGTPGAGTDSGSPYSVNVTVTDANGVTSSVATLSLTVTAAPVITTTTLPDGTETGVYPATLIAATGGTPPYSWSATGLPSGLVLDSLTGILSGTLAAGTAAGSPYTVTVTLTDNAGATATQGMTLTVNAVPTITTASLPNAQDLVIYGPVTLTMTGGTGTMTWSVTPALPTSMTFDTATGTIAGTPDAGTNTGSPYSFNFTVTDLRGVTSATQTLSLTVIP